MVDFQVELFDGQYHDVDSSEMAFKIAGSLAFKDAVAKCRPTILEPVMKVEIAVPEDYAGAVMGDLSSRRGRPQGMEPRGGAAGDQGRGAALGDALLRRRAHLDDGRRAARTTWRWRTTTRCPRTCRRRSSPQARAERGDTGAEAMESPRSRARGYTGRTETRCGPPCSPPLRLALLPRAARRPRTLEGRGHGRSRPQAHQVRRPRLSAGGAGRGLRGHRDPRAGRRRDGPGGHPPTSCAACRRSTRPRSPRCGNGSTR